MLAYRHHLFPVMVTVHLAIPCGVEGTGVLTARHAYRLLTDVHDHDCDIGA